MIRIPSPLRHMPTTAILFLAGVAGASSAASAQSTPAVTQSAAVPGDTVRLSDEERKAIVDTQTVESAAAARGEMAGSDRAALGIHGEVGAMIGSNGTRGAYGVAAIPLGDHAAATVSFESSRFGYRR